MKGQTGARQVHRQLSVRKENPSHMQMFDPREGQWGLMEPMKTARQDFAAVVIGAELWVLGGVNETGILSCTERYNTGKQVWRDGPLLRQKRSGHGAFAM